MLQAVKLPNIQCIIGGHSAHLHQKHVPGLFFSDEPSTTRHSTLLGKHGNFGHTKVLSSYTE